MLPQHSLQVAQSRIDEWHKEADVARMLAEARREQRAQRESSRVALVLSAALRGIGSRLVHAGNWLDARSAPQTMVCEEG